jgi:hypothetical protein
MNPVKIFVPLFAIIGLAVTAPGWSHWLGKLSSTPPHVQFLGGILLPFLVLLLGASWLEPRRGS